MEEQIESTSLPGISQELVSRYGADKLRRLIDGRGDPVYYFEYDRGTVRDGANITPPFSCNRHQRDNPKRNWLAVRLVHEHDDHKVGTKWREVEALPDVLMVAGESA